jgi:hypothetical protein
MGLDIYEAITLWKSELKNDITDRYDNENNYVIEFRDKSNQVVGNITTYPGQGIRWNYPQELIDAYKTNQ